jgi:hypothetical protein
MPIYKFKCENNHEQEVMLSFTERDDLPKDEGGRQFIPCDVKYGNMKQPVCPFNAYQDYGSVGFVVQHLKRR